MGLTRAQKACKHADFDDYFGCRDCGAGHEDLAEDELKDVDPLKLAEALYPHCFDPEHEDDWSNTSNLDHYMELDRETQLKVLAESTA